jgi:quercetin dioxygenase-like cupin family protein
MRTTHAIVLAAALMLAVPALLTAQQAAPAGTVIPAFNRAIPNVPGKSLVAAVVSYPPGGRSGSHRHAPSAFIAGYVLSGSIRSAVDDGPEEVYGAGQTFFESPGAHHRVSANASESEPASLLAIFVVDTGAALTIPDPR